MHSDGDVCPVLGTSLLGPASGRRKDFLSLRPSLSSRSPASQMRVNFSRTWIIGNSGPMNDDFLFRTLEERSLAWRPSSRKASISIPVSPVEWIDIGQGSDGESGLML